MLLRSITVQHWRQTSSGMEVDPGELDLQACHRVGGPFASFVSHFEDTDSNLVLALALAIVLMNLIFGGTLLLLAKLCDRGELYRKRRRRAELISKKIDEHLAAYNRREVLRVHQVNHANAKIIRPYVNLDQILSDIEDEKPAHQTLSLWMQKLDQIERELSVQANKVNAAEMGLRELSKVTWTEKTFQFLAVPGAGFKCTFARCGTLAAGSILFLLTILPIVLGPFIILAHDYCDRWISPNDNLTTAFWILYAILTCLPAALAWRVSIKALWHWTHAPCIECIEAPNVHSEHVGRMELNTQFVKDVRERTLSEGSDTTLGSSPISPTSPTHRCGSPTDLCGLPRISEDEREEYEEKMDLGCKERDIIRRNWS